MPKFGRGEGGIQCVRDAKQFAPWVGFIFLNADDFFMDHHITMMSENVTIMYRSNYV